MKQTKIHSSVDTLLGEPTSYKDAGYRIARIGEGSQAVAAFMVKDPAFAANPKVNDHKEIRHDLAEGYKMRAHELKGQSYYIVSKDTGAWLELCNTHDDDDWKAKLEKAQAEKREVKILNVHVASGYSQQEFGRMKKEDPAMHEAISAWRTYWRGYEHNCNASLEEAVRNLFKAKSGEKKTRTTVDFVDSVKKSFDSFEKSVKVKQDRGDETADPVRFRMARDAFWKVYNK